MELQSAIAVLRRRGMRTAFSSKLWGISLSRLAEGIGGDEPDDVALRNAVLSIANVNKTQTRVQPRESARPAENDIFAVEASNSGTDIYAVNKLREQWKIEGLFRNLPDEVTRPYMETLISSLPPGLQLQPRLRPRLKMMLQKSTYGT